jgi:hypothetical protein
MAAPLESQPIPMTQEVFRRTLKEAEERLERIHEEAKVVIAKSWYNSNGEAICALGEREKVNAAQ